MTPDSRTETCDDVRRSLRMVMFSLVKSVQLLCNQEVDTGRHFTFQVFLEFHSHLVIDVRSVAGGWRPGC